MVWGALRDKAQRVDQLMQDDILGVTGGIDVGSQLETRRAFSSVREHSHEPAADTTPVARGPAIEDDV